jgi:hypothetical protein
MNTPFEIIGEAATMCDPETGVCAVPTTPDTEVSTSDAETAATDNGAGAVAR